MDYIKAFIIGGLLCVIGQVLIDKTKLTPARILVGYVVAGVILGAIGVYEPFVEFAGCGAATPLTGFGYLISKGVKEAVAEKGLLGALTGPLTAAAGGTAAALVFPGWSSLPVNSFLSLHSFLYHFLLLGAVILPLSAGEIHPMPDEVKNRRHHKLQAAKEQKR